MGTSYKYNQPVSELIADKIPVTFTLTAIAFVMILLVSVPFGILCAKYEYMDRPLFYGVESGDDVDSAVFCGNDSDGGIWTCASMVYAGRLHFL